MDMPEFERWLKQAENSLESAKVDKKNGYYNWACFKCQQAGEYALKGLLRAFGKVAIGHSCYKLANQLKDLGVRMPRKMYDACRVLDRHYIPTRYPDAFPDASPFEFYDEATAEQAIDAAQEIVGFVKVQVKQDAQNC